MVETEKKLGLELFFKIWFQIILGVITAIGILFYSLLVYNTGIANILLKHGYLPIWFGIFVIPLPVTIFNLIYLLAYKNRTKYKHCDYSQSTNPSTRLNEREIYLDDKFYFKCVEYKEQVGDPYVEARGPFCLESHCHLLPKVHWFSGKLLKYWCSTHKRYYEVASEWDTDIIENAKNEARTMFYNRGN